jgi:metal-sulfur cluster biosynthetic enzyme
MSATNRSDGPYPEQMKIRIELIWEPAWTTDRMSPEGKAFRGW